MGSRLSIWQRYGGHLLFIILVTAGLIGRKVLLAEEGNQTAVSTEPVASLPVNQTENDAKSAISGDVVLDLSSFPYQEDTSLSPVMNPQTYQPKLPEHNFQTYVVQRGDSPGSIAESFGIQPETILGGNPFLSEESSLLQTDVELTILPVDGVLHDVSPGDTLAKISEQYGIPQEEIVAYAPNNLTFPYRLTPGTQIVVPGAIRDLFVWNPPTLADVSGRGNGTSPGRGVNNGVRGTGTFIWPVISRYFTQYYWYGHQAIDVALPEGSAVVASDTGTVTYAGWNTTGYGYLIVVNHGNGYETFYAHLSGINVRVGQVVTQGQYIGATGNTGNSSGPHIHFEVRSNGTRLDPCWYIPC